MDRCIDIFNSCLWFFHTLSVFSPLWVVTAEDWAVAVCCTDSALLMLFSGSRAFIRLLGSWLLSLGVPGDSRSWIVLTVYAKLVSFSFLVVYLSCRLPVLLSSVVKLGVSDVFAEVESCSSVCYYMVSIVFHLFLMPRCKTLSSVWAVLMLWMSWALIIPQTFLHIIFFSDTGNLANFRSFRFKTIQMFVNCLKHSWY